MYMWMQVDVTEERENELRMAQVSEACVSLLELMFPRHGECLCVCVCVCVCVCACVRVRDR